MMSHNGMPPAGTPEQTPDFLRAELARKEKIIQALMDRFEREMDAQGSEYGLFQTAVMLDGEVRERTRVLEMVMSDLRGANIALERERKKVDTVRTRLFEAIESMSEGFVLFDAGGRLVLCNDIYRKLWGIDHVEAGATRAQLAARIVAKGLFTTEDARWFASELSSFPRSAECLLGDGRWVRISERLTAEGGLVGIHADISDIKARENRRRERELAEKSALLQATLDNLLQGVAVFDGASRLTVWNPQLAPMLMLPDDYLVAGLPYQTFAHHDPLPEELATLPHPPAEAVRFERSLGDERFLSVYRAPMPDGGFVITCTDISERKRSELALQRAKNELEQRVEERTRELRISRERFRDLAESASDWYRETDAELRFTYISEHFFTVTGTLPDDILGRRRWELVAPEVLAQDEERWRRHREDMESKRAFRAFEYPLPARDGGVRIISITGKPCFDDAGTFIGYRGTGSDVSLFVQAQEELLRSEKLASLGSLVAGVAHEINTPIGISVTAASLLADKVTAFRESYAAGKMRRSEMDNFIAAAMETSAALSSNLNRAAELVRSFKQVAVDQSSEHKRALHLKDYIEEILLSLQPKMKRTGHRVEIDVPGQLSLYCDPGAISQILTNLIINSLTHAFADREDGVMRISARLAGEEIQLSYSDSGSGMSSEVADRMFEPFFTTRRGYGGSGLGMYLVYNLVTQTLHGRIECITSPGQGVLFNIGIPARTAGN